MNREFHLGDILSVTTGLLVSPSHIGGVYDILNWMTGDNLFTHQLPRAAEECKPELLRQHPDLAKVVTRELHGEAEVAAWLTEQVAIYGEYLEVTPLAPEDHTRIGPLTELQMMRPGMPIVAIATEEPS